MAVELLAFVSTKGGTGKTTLGVVTALGLAAKGRRVAVYDLDLTGSSIADGLPLLAPRGEAGLEAPCAGLLTRAATVDARMRRARSGVKELAFLNDALLSPQHSERVDPTAYAWRRSEDDPIAWFPSSPCHHEIAVGAGWLGRADLEKLAIRFYNLAARAVERLGLDTIILDLPPGIAGFTDLFLRQRRTPSGPFAAVTPVYVFTSDRNDLYPSVDFAARSRVHYPKLKLVLNRNREPLDSVHRAVRTATEPLLGPSGIEQLIRGVSTHQDTLGRIFVSDPLAVPANVTEEVLRAVEEP